MYQFIYDDLPELLEQTSVFMTDQVETLRAERDYVLDTRVEVNALSVCLMFSLISTVLQNKMFKMYFKH